MALKETEDAGWNTGTMTANVAYRILQKLAVEYVISINSKLCESPLHLRRSILIASEIGSSLGIFAKSAENINLNLA